MFRCSALCTVLLVLICGMTPVANAQITNGDFETGDMTGWTPFGDCDGVVESAAWLGNIPAHGGDYVLGNGVNQGLKVGGAYQHVSVLIGTEYQIIGWTHNGGDTDSANFCRVGIADGIVTDPAYYGIQWSNPISADTAWAEMSSWGLVATESTMTVFVEMTQIWPLEWNLNRVDDIELVALTAVSDWMLY